jgi:hypothetical protein
VTANRKVIVAGRPRSGTSLMMHLLAMSGYRCLRDPAWEDWLRPARKNAYFYEHGGFVHSGDMALMEGYDVGKVMPGAIKHLPPDEVVIVWMDRRKEDVIASQAAYDRQALIGRPLDEDYEQWDVDELLAPFVHVRLSYDALVSEIRPKKES